MIFKDKRDSYDLAFDYEQVEGTTPEPNVRCDVHRVMRLTYTKQYKLETVKDMHVFRQTWLKKYGSAIYVGRK